MTASLGFVLLDAIISITISSNLLNATARFDFTQSKNRKDKDFDLFQVNNMKFNLTYSIDNMGFVRW